MSYVVLARKWRPQSFEDLVGQDHVSTTNWVLTLVLLSFLVPAHARIVLGPFGPPPVTA